VLSPVRATFARVANVPLGCKLVAEGELAATRRNVGGQLPIRGRPGVRLELEVAYHAGQKHLPIVTIKRAA